MLQFEIYMRKGLLGPEYMLMHCGVPYTQLSESDIRNHLGTIFKTIDRTCEESIHTANRHNMEFCKANGLSEFIRSDIHASNPWWKTWSLVGFWWSCEKGLEWFEE